nr:TonB-dependent receptor [Spongiibacter marinus]
MAQPGDTQRYALEEVVVTAQKKAESLQDAPISLTAFGQQALENKGINSLADIGANVPSMSIEPFPINNATLRIFIRGIGISDAQITQDPPVGIYMDGVYIARSTGTALDVADLERIEILRGPQGTLYGRNTTGGAINLVSKRPNTEAFEFEQKFTVGDRYLLTSKTSANIPITDTLAAKLAFLHTEQDGFVENTGPGGDFGDREVQGYRMDVRWDINDSLTLDYAYDHS